MISIANYYINASQDYSEIITSYKPEWLPAKNAQMINAEEGVEGRES